MEKHVQEYLKVLKEHIESLHAARDRAGRLGMHGEAQRLQVMADLATKLETAIIDRTLDSHEENKLRVLR